MSFSLSKTSVLDTQSVALPESPRSLSFNEEQQALSAEYQRLQPLKDALRSQLEATMRSFHILLQSSGCKAAAPTAAARFVDR